MKNFIKSLLMVALTFSLLTWQSCRKDDNTPQNTVEKYDAKLAQEWMQAAYDAVKANGLFALDASRIYSYTAISMYESMVHGLPQGKSLAGQLQGLQTLPQPEPGKSYDWAIVMCHATPAIIEATLPNINQTTVNNLRSLANKQESELQAEYKVSDQVIKNSKDYADELVDAILAWAATDNRINLEKIAYTEPSTTGNPQFWKGSTLGQNFMMPYWWTSRPFAINSYQICEPAAPLAYSSDPSSAYYKEVEEVYQASFDPQKIAVGTYWANNPGLSGTPAGSWLGIACQLVDQYELDLTTTLRMYVLMTISTRDGFIACWYMKFKYNLQRPVTYIREVMGHGTWASAVPTPPYPDYTSGTSTNAGSSSAVLIHLFGDKPFTDSQHVDKGFGTKSFSSFSQAGSDAFHSRIYGGVHMRRACELGFEHGKCMANYIIDKIDFTK